MKEEVEAGLLFKAKLSQSFKIESGITEIIYHYFTSSESRLKFSSTKRGTLTAVESILNIHIITFLQGPHHWLHATTHQKQRNIRDLK